MSLNSFILENQQIIKAFDAYTCDDVLLHLKKMQQGMLDLQNKMATAKKLHNSMISNVSSIKTLGYYARSTVIDTLRFLEECMNLSPKKKDPEIWVIDGNIGAGKSTLVNNLSQRLRYDSRVLVVEEPLHKWRDFLPTYYSDPQKYAILMQTLVATAHTDNVNEVISDPENAGVELFIFERDVQSCNIFAKALGLDDMSLKLINGVVEKFTVPKKIRIYPVTKRILLGASPERCLRRIAKREREGEDLVKLSFLEELDRYTEEYYNTQEEKNDWTVLDAKSEPDELVNQCTSLIMDHLNKV